jgi:hypothetical protein
VTSFFFNMRATRAAEVSATPSATPSAPAVPRIVYPRRRLHVLITLFALATYSVITLLDTSLPQLLAFSAIALLATLAFRLPWRMLLTPLLAIGLLAAGLAWPIGLLPLVAAGSARILCIVQYLAIFGARTSTSNILDLFSTPLLRRRSLSSLTYLLSTTVAVLPSIQHDLRKSMDGVILRRGGRAALLFPSAWVDVVLDEMVRASLRSQRLADAVSDRGYRLASGLVPLPGRRLGARDALAGIALLLPALIVLYSGRLAELPQVAQSLNLLHELLRKLLRELP